MIRSLRASLLAHSSRFWPYLAVAVAFFASRLVYWFVFDLNFDHSPVSYFIQYLHSWFIVHDFWRSLMYLHQQPPLQNLLTGGFMRLFGSPAAFTLLWYLYVALGLVNALALLHVMLRLGAARWLAVVAVVLHTAAPETVYFESWLFYHQPVATLLLLSLVCLLRYYRSGTALAGFGFFFCFACTGLFYAIFHPVLLAAATVGILWRPPLVRGRALSRWRVLGAAAFPFILLLGNVQKTKALTGYGQGSAFLWENLAVKTFAEIPLDERQWLIDSGYVTRAPNLPLFPVPLSLYNGGLRVPHPPTGVPLLDMPEMPDGQTNPHSLEKVLIAEKFYKKDSFYLLQHRFPDYWEAVIKGLTSYYFMSPLDYDGTLYSPNREKLRSFNGFLSRLFLADAGGRQLLLVVLFPLTLIYGVHRVFRPRSVLRSERAPVVLVAHMVLVIVYITFATIMISAGDFSRYRFNIDPLYLILFVLMASDARHGAVVLKRSLVQWRNRRRTVAASGAEMSPAASSPATDGQLDSA